VRAVAPPGTSPAASSHLQRGSRAAHATAKAHVRPTGVPEGPWSGPSGYGVRHVRTAWFGTGEARLPTLVSKDRSYKPVVKSSGWKRESDGVVVPLITVRNAAGGKGPDFGRAGNRGTREDMIETARSNHPDGPTPGAHVRQVQSRLWAAAKQAFLSRSTVLDPRRGDFSSGDSGSTSRGGCVTMLRRPSVSCVRENRMHSSMGAGNGASLLVLLRVPVRCAEMPPQRPGREPAEEPSHRASTRPKMTGDRT